MAYLLDKQDVNTLQQVTREVLGDLGGGRANYHREVQRRTVAETPEGVEVYNWQVVCNNITVDAQGVATATIAIHQDAPCVAKILPVKWQRVTLGSDDDVQYILLHTGESFTREQVPATADGELLVVQLPCVVYIKAIRDTYQNKLVELNALADSDFSSRDVLYGDYGERSSAVANGDKVALATIDANGVVTQLERGVPALMLLYDPPSDIPTLEQNGDLLPAVR